jgi:DNA-binding transcriptional MocR family regulator
VPARPISPCAFGSGFSAEAVALSVATVNSRCSCERGPETKCAGGRGSHERYLEIVEHLEEGLRRDPERAQAALTGAIGSRITLVPDESGMFLWAELGLETAPQLVAVGPLAGRAALH